MPGTEVTYPPIDRLKPVAEGVWIVDSGPLRLAGMPLPVRMTVVRLAAGDLWLHSPTSFDPGLRGEMERLGPIRHLVAPSISHWSFLQQWQAACPEATTWAAPGLRRRPAVKKSGLRLDHDLSDTPPPEWAGEIEHVVIRGAGGFREVDFFHQASRTLVLTDLVVNVEPKKLPLFMRPGAHLAGATAPHGKAPIYLRALVQMRRKEAARAAARLVAFGPERVIFSHGRWFESNGTAELRRSLRWLL